MVRLISFKLFLFIQVLITTCQAFDHTTNCTSGSTYTKNSTYQTNLINLLTNLTSQALYSGFYTSVVGQHPNQVYGQYLCRGDVDNQGCSQCVCQAHLSILPECPSQTSAITWYNFCMLRFSNVPFFNRLGLTPSMVEWGSQNITTGQARVLVELLISTKKDLVPQIAQSRMKYGTKVINTTSSMRLYTLQQCTLDLQTDECSQCLTRAIDQLEPMLYLGGRALLPSCTVRFEVSSFYSNLANSSFFLPAIMNSTAAITPHEKRHQRSSLDAVFVCIPVVLAIILLFGAFFCIRNPKNAEPSLDEISSAESLQFQFKQIRAATDNFTLDNKLGEGGFGAVYKGTLQNGQEIAVKRLSTKSDQGLKEFKTEVLLVAKLQHKNLVKLLGFCLRAKEKLLVYELLPNSSLDKVLLDLNKEQSLDWETRYRIIIGIARGLLYLHQDSRLKIIHRDLKSSNILLDQNMEPKISDFGLARLVGADQIQGDTSRIVGTYGYMAPEYAMTGRFSDKSDVYSFGVIVLEILSGRKCSSTVFPYNEESLVERTWKLWSINAATELVDPRLGVNNFSIEEVSRCVHIALLCIQEDAGKRPTMAPIVSALNGHSVALPVPAPPHLVIITTANSSAQTSSTFAASEDITEVYPR